MKILIKPSEIIKRCLWDNYVYYVLGSEKEGEALLKEDNEVEIHENDALVIGLLKVIETDNLIHKFNDYLIHFLTLKSIKHDDDIYSKKKSLEVLFDKFFNKFPSYWEPPLNYKRSMEDLLKYVEEVKAKIEKLEVKKINVQNLQHDVYSASSIKKVLNFNNY